MNGTGALLGLTTAVGALFIVSFIAARRPLRTVDRIRPYIAAPHPRGGGRLTESALAVIRQLLTTRTAVGRQMRKGVDPLDSRIERLVWTAGGGLLGASIGVVTATASGSVVVVVILGVAGAATGRLGWNRSTALAARRRERLLDAQLPAAVELVALAVAAGEPIVSALDRVGSATPDPLGSEFRTFVADVRAGSGTETALSQLSRRCGCRSIERFVDGLAVAIERGTPLAAILRAQAVDARAEGLRRLMESAGRKDALMLAPVVFLVLPAVVAVALFPGIQTLRLVVP